MGLAPILRTSILRNGTAIAMALALMAGPALADKISNTPSDTVAAQSNPPVTIPAPSTSDTATVDASGIDFGDDASDWANDDECDDPRFVGDGAASTLLDDDIKHDATDCRTAFEAGKVTLKGADDTTITADTPKPPTTAQTTTLPDGTVLDFGTDSGEWATDEECDDPRFIGEGSATELVNEDIRKDATDCRAAFEAGTVTLRANHAEIDRAAAADETVVTTTTVEFDYGDDSSRYANDDECDDPRFAGPATSKKLLVEDMNADAADCRAAVSSGTATIRKAWDPAYTAGAPFDISAIEWGDDSSSFSNDDECDDTRFEGPGAVLGTSSSEENHDATDCKAAFVAGTVALKE